MMSTVPRKPKAPTATTKAHRFEPFTKRISKIKIDPVHTVQKSRITEDHNDLTKSFFRTALDEWSELNLSRDFTSFLNKASPLSETLPQLLHHADKIFELLFEHIARKDELALEPLLSLVAHLAHDLGQVFQTYFAQTVKLVASVSASVEDPAVIECCFTCLAWTFKYLSKSLVQDLRPLLEIMIPYMSAKKVYMRRFTAESLAFLVRKAAVLHSRKPEPLQHALTYLFEQVEERSDDAEVTSYEYALMTLLAESSMGIDLQLHSSAASLMGCALSIVSKLSLSIRATKVLEGTVVSLIHRTTAQGFQSLLNLIIEQIQSLHTKNSKYSPLYAILLQAVTVTRKGSRVQDWKTIIELIITQRAIVPAVDAHSQAVYVNDLSTVASIIQYAPMDQLLPQLTRLLDCTTNDLPTNRYFAFCETVADLGRERFQDLILPRLQKFISIHWVDGETGLLYLLRQLHGKQISNISPASSGYIALPQNWEQTILQRLGKAHQDSVFPQSYSAYFQLMETSHFPREKQNIQQLQALLISSAQQVFQRSKRDMNADTRLTLGWALQSSLKHCEVQPTLYTKLWHGALQEPEDSFTLEPFLSACVQILQKLGTDDIKEDQFLRLLAILCQNMLGDDVRLREVTLQILQQSARLGKNSWLTDTCELLLEVLRTPYLPSSARQIEMLLRRLPARQSEVDPSSDLRRLIPLFSIGMMRHYHDQTRRALCSILSQMATKGNAEDVIIEVATRWLQTPGFSAETAEPNASSELPSKLSPFECSNLNMVRKLTLRNEQQYSDAADHLKTDFEQAHQLHLPRTPIDGRELALQIFLHMTEVAERRSRVLVPAFLSISHGKINDHVPQSDESSSSHTISPELEDQNWSLRDRKAFVELLSRFVNPRVLYRSREVYDSLMELLTNGNAEIRKLALTALINWKDSSVQQYQDVLLRVAEEKTATTELALLLSDNEDSASVKPNDREAVLPFLLRLIFGQLIGRSGSHGSQEAKRKSILRLLFRMESKEIMLFLEIALGRLREVSMTEKDRLSHILARDLISSDQQYGFLRMMLSMMDILQSQFAPFGSKVVNAVLYCTARSCHQINATSEDVSSPASALVRNTRRTGLQCLTLLFALCQDLDWSPYVRTIFSEMVSPRLATFATENTQGISALLRLFATWAKSSRLLHLLDDYDQRLLGSVWDTLSASTAQHEVKLFILDELLEPLTETLELSRNVSSHGAMIMDKQVDGMLRALSAILEQQPAKDVLLSSTRVIQQIASYATTSSAARDVLGLLIKLLCEPSQRIPPHIKGSLLHATQKLLRSASIGLPPASRDRLYEVVASLFSYFKDQPNRAILGKILLELCKGDGTVSNAINICDDLNSQSSTHLDQLDYERRLAGFNTINDLPVDDGTKQQWLPLIHNLLYFARSSEDFAIRSNAVNCLKRYIFSSCQSENMAMLDIVRHTLLPASKKGARDDSELVRADFVAMFGLIVQTLPDASDLEDMKVLLVGGDEEASFFSNVLHIQQHRRIRAIRRLVSEIEQGRITSSNISEFFLPLLNKFINDDSSDESAQGIKGQSISAVGAIYQWIDWKTFRRIFRQYKQDLETTPRPEKDTIKLLNNAADALTAAMDQSTHIDPKESGIPRLAASLPSQETLREELRSNLIPKLAKFVHLKDDTEISLRIPAAQVAIKLIKLLTEDEIAGLAAPILLDISQILRSRTQESRDIARNTLAEIVVLLGPSSIDFVLKELRTTLTRGYQLHVLSYTVHTILLASSPYQQSGDIDYCIEDLVAVVMDDIFGTTGQEKQNEDYISSMKEVKSSKSFDSMEHLAKSTSVRSLSKLIRPFQSLLTGNLTTKQLRHVDELLRRTGVGISHNPAASSRDLLVFAYEMIQAFYKQKTTGELPKLTNDEKNRARFIVQLDSAHKQSSSGNSSSLLYKIARFALDIVRSTLVRHTSLMTAENVHGFLPVIGDALIEAQEDVKISALRLLSAVIKLPIPEIDKNASLYVMEGVKVVRGAISTNEEASQAALKLVTAVLRERKEVQVRDSDISYLLQRTMPDIEEPDRQGVTFNFIKAVLARGYQLPEIYELVDKIGIMMVTSQNRPSRDVARGVYVHFLLDYPQSKGRWSKQLKFLVKNLEYQYPEGRQSIMEAVHVLLQKIGANMSSELVSTFFIPIVLCMANDDHQECREMAGSLLANMYRKSSEDQLKTLVEPLRAWVEQTDNLALTKLSLQAWNILFDNAGSNAENEVTLVRKAASRGLQTEIVEEDDWEIQYQSLELLQQLTKRYPAAVLTAKQQDVWISVFDRMNSPHVWVQISAASLVTSFFQNCISSGPARLPLTASYGLHFGAEVVLELLRKSVKVLKRNEGNNSLASHMLQILLFLGRFAEANSMTMQIKSQQQIVEDNVEIEDASDTGSDEERALATIIPALQYLLDQCIHVLRREPSKLTSAAFLPRLSSLNLLTTLIPQLDITSLSTHTMTALLVPLSYITDPAIEAPRSADPTFSATYTSYTETAQSLLEAVQKKVGDKEYVKLMTAVSKIVRERRANRRQKRAIERVAEPEKAALYKKRKGEKRKEKGREIRSMYRKGRREGH